MYSVRLSSRPLPLTVEDPRLGSFHCDIDDDGNVIDIADTPTFAQQVIKTAVKLADEFDLY